MTVDQMRDRISQVYPGPNWEWKVSEMDDRQVVAIYKSMESKDRFYAVKPKHNEWMLPQYRDTLMNEHAEQLSMWDILAERKDEQTTNE